MTNNPSAWRRFREFYTARNEPEYFRPLAEIGWRALLFVFLIAIGGVIVFAVMEFWSVTDSLNSGSGTITHPPAVLDRKALTATLDMIQKRQDDFTALSASPQPVVDPSK